MNKSTELSTPQSQSPAKIAATKIVNDSDKYCSANQSNHNIATSSALMSCNKSFSPAMVSKAISSSQCGLSGYNLAIPKTANTGRRDDAAVADLTH